MLRSVALAGGLLMSSAAAGQMPDGAIAEWRADAGRAGAGPTVFGHNVEATGQEMTLALRLKAEGTWDGPILSRANETDPLGKILYVRDGMLEYLWRTTPLAERVIPGWLGSARFGFNGESNDQHHLLAYRADEWGVSVLTLDETGHVTLLHNGSEASGDVSAEIQSVGDSVFRVGAKHNDEEWLEGEIAEVLVYDRTLSAEERRSVHAAIAGKWGLGKGSGQVPTQGLLLRLDANALGEGRVAHWPDRTGPGSVAQHDEARQPRLVHTAPGGRPAVRFDGGQCLDSPAVLEAGDSSLSFVAVWRRDDTAGSQVIFEQASPGRGKRACLLTTGTAQLGQDLMDGTLRIGVPVADIGPEAWRDVVVRFRGPNLEMFVDGVLVDEEWPHGALHGSRGPFAIGAGYVVDRVAMWDRALSDDEITSLSGGAEAVARRGLEILSPEQTSLQYWKPRGHNAFAGDCIPFYHDGVLHLFYLFDRRHHGSKWGQGAHQYAHVTTRDLLNWQHHPLAVPIIRQWECSMGTGDAIARDGAIHVFYTDCGGRCEYLDKPQRGSWVFAATSTDGINFHKDLVPLVEGHDCEVFQDPATGLYHLVRGGGNRLVSTDLRNWQETPGDFVPRRPGTSAECPNHFEWNGWFYFILGRNALWRSRSALGPWEEISPTVYDGLMVPKVAEFTGNRRLLAGFLEWPGWGGHTVFRELIQHEDGSLGTKWVPEMIPPAGDPVKTSFGAVQGGVSLDDGAITLDGSDGLAICALDGVPGDARVTLRAEPGEGVEAYGVTVRGAQEYGGCELRLEPGRQRAQWGTPSEGRLAPDAQGAIWAGGDFAIGDVTNLGEPVTLDVITTGSIVDACIDGRRTMVTRRRGPADATRVFLFVQGGRARFRAVSVRPIQR